MKTIKIIFLDGTEVPTDKIHTLKSLAEKLGVVVSTVYFWKLSGKIKSVFISSIEFVLEPDKNDPIMLKLKERRSRKEVLK